MQRVIVGLIAIALPLAACSGHKAHTEHEHPAHVEHIEGSDLSKVTLTAKAAERIGLETSKVTEEQVLSTSYLDRGAGWQTRRVIPYSALTYDPHGRTWVYTSPEPLTFVRAEVKIHRIEGDKALLDEGPDVGTVVASVGVAEIYGTEFEVGH